MEGWMAPIENGTKLGAFPHTHDFQANAWFYFGMDESEGELQFMISSVKLWPTRSLDF